MVVPPELLAVPPHWYKTNAPGACGGCCMYVDVCVNVKTNQGGNGTLHLPPFPTFPRNTSPLHAQSAPPSSWPPLLPCPCPPPPSATPAWCCRTPTPWCSVWPTTLPGDSRSRAWGFLRRWRRGLGCVALVRVMCWRGWRGEWMRCTDSRHVFLTHTEDVSPPASSVPPITQSKPNSKRARWRCRAGAWATRL